MTCALVARGERRDNRGRLWRKDLSDQKYRQRGYQDSGGKEKKSFGEKPPKRDPDNTFGPRPLQMAATRAVSRCAECGNILLSDADASASCLKCGFALHSCKQCSHFDPSCRFECGENIPMRIQPKDKVNDCTFYAMRVMLEKETSSQPIARPDDARRAFDNLFKK